MAEDFRRLVLNRYCRCISAEVKMAYLPKRAALKMPYSTDVYKRQGIDISFQVRHGPCFVTCIVYHLYHFFLCLDGRDGIQLSVCLLYTSSEEVWAPKIRNYYFNPDYSHPTRTMQPYNLWAQSYYCLLYTSPAPGSFFQIQRLRPSYLYWKARCV